MRDGGVATLQTPQTEDDLARELHQKLYANPLLLPFQDALILYVDSTTNPWQSHVGYATQEGGKKPERQTEVEFGRRNIRRFSPQEVNRENAHGYASTAASQLQTLGPLYQRDPQDLQQDSDMVFTLAGFRAYVSEMERTHQFLSQFSDGPEVAKLCKTIDDVKGMFPN